MGDTVTWTNFVPPAGRVTLVAFNVLGRFPSVGAGPVALVFTVRVPVNPFRLVRVTLTNPVLPCGTEREVGGTGTAEIVKSGMVVEPYCPLLVT